jgi:hypothetical protein
VLLPVGIEIGDKCFAQLPAPADAGVTGKELSTLGITFAHLDPQFHTFPPLFPNGARALKGNVTKRKVRGISRPPSGERPVGTGYSSRASLLSRCSEPGFLLSPGVGASAGIVTPRSFVVTGARFGAS